MADDGFFGFLGMLSRDAWDRRQQRELEALETRADLARVAADGNADAIARVEQRVARLSRDVDGLRVVLEVLGHALVDSGGVDRAVLDERMRTALAAFAAKSPAPPVVCGNCGLSFPAAQVTDAGAGPRCRKCRDL